ncbi:MAG: RibD family protein [Candidatus Bathyarchaeota archaeon]|nr:RibD family protein [Candidatus Bathyarchaeota archaeon]
MHYEVLGRIGADALLVGSNTAKKGIESCMTNIPTEEQTDFSKPKVEAKDDKMVWVIADSRGILQGQLHVLRRAEYAKDIIVLASNRTPKEYLDYLTERNYDFIVAGHDHVDYRMALELLNKRYGVKRVATDSGGVLSSILLDEGLVEEVQLLVAPTIVGKKAMNLFRTLNQSVNLKLEKLEKIDADHALLVYRTHM